MTERVPKDERVVRCPNSLSLSTNPEEALATITAFRRYLDDGGTAEICLDYSGTADVDLGTGAVMMAMARDAQTRGYRIKVLVPSGSSALNRLIVCGLAHVFGRETNLALPASAILPLDRMVKDEAWSEVVLQQRAGASASRVLTRLTNWLVSQGRPGLSADFERWVGNALGEVLDNIPRHTDAGWWVCADVVETTNARHIVDIAIFNFGNSIYETMQKVPRTSETKRQMDILLTEHRRRGFFNEGWSPENLVTLFALQDAVTSRGEEQRAGAGTRSTIQGFQYLCSRQGAPDDIQLCWISGHTQVVMDGRYRLGPSKVEFRKDIQGLQDLALNATNDLYEAPDPAVVRNLRVAFPGTLLSLRFPLIREYLSTRGEE